jgi:hypothetical protein
MCSLPDQGRIITVDRSNNVGVPALEAPHCQRSQRAKVDDFMTSGICIRKHAREALVASPEVVELVARD